MSIFLLTTIKALYGRSHNECAFPGCSSPVIEDTGTVTAEICHIRATSPRGPRYDPHQTPKERNSVDNLVLMCGRHHKIIDTEVRKYTVPELLKIKKEHEGRGPALTLPDTEQVARKIMESYARISVIGNSGNVAIQSPGAIQANSITFKTTRTRVSIQPPSGSVGANRAMVAYCEYLIDRYKKYKIADKTGKGDFKHHLIYQAIQRKFGASWKLVDEGHFPHLVEFLQQRIDKTIIGKNNRKRSHQSYRTFDAWMQDSERID